MALKPSQITRRNFVQRAGLLVTSLGVAGGIQSGLMDSIIRKAQFGVEGVDRNAHFLSSD